MNFKLNHNADLFSLITEQQIFGISDLLLDQYYLEVR